MAEYPYAEIQGNRIIRKGFLEFPDREIGEVREDVDSSIKYFQGKFEIISQKVDELENKINESSNKGSYLMKLIHLRDSLANYDGIGDFESLFNRLNAKEEYLNEIIQQNRVKNLEIKRALLQELDALKDHYNLQEASDRIKEIKNNWIKTGAVPKENQEEFESTFTSYLDHFYKRMQVFSEDRRKMTEEIVSDYQRIVEKAGEIVHKYDVHEAASGLKKLQKEWKELGRIPPEEYQILKNKFQKINDDLFAKLKELKKKEQENRNERVKDLMIKKGNLLNELNKEIKDGTKDLRTIRKDFIYRWRKTGNIFQKDIHRLNEKFRMEIQKIDEELFLENLVRKKQKNFDRLNLEEKDRSRIKVLKELISRDEKDLNQFQKNLEIFSLKTGKIDKMVNNKMQGKESSLKIKKSILKRYESK